MQTTFAELVGATHFSESAVTFVSIEHTADDNELASKNLYASGRPLSYQPAPPICASPDVRSIDGA
jgi:hypothetical protein